MMERDSEIFIAGSTGLVGSALTRALKKQGYWNLVNMPHSSLDLCNQKETQEFFEEKKPEYVFMAAGKVGGIGANVAKPAQFIYDNMLIIFNTIDAAWRSGCKKLLFLGSSCIYPKFAPQPMREDSLLKGELEPTNDCYALSKISGIRMGQAYREQYGFDVISAMPTNLYGPCDNFNLETSHVVPALMRKFHEAVANNHDEVVLWGTGKPLREFLHVDDLAEACIFLMNNYSDREHVNVGSGEEVSISKLAEMIAEITGFKGKITLDASKPDGTPRKLLDCSKIKALGWSPKISLKDGIASTYNWYHAQKVY